MPQHDIDSRLLERWLAGECDAAEHAEVSAWLESDPRHRALADALKRAVRADTPDQQDWDVEDAWARMTGRLTPPRLVPRLRLVDADRNPFPRRVSAWLAAAAAVAVVAGGAWLLERSTPERTAAAVMQEPREFATARAQRLALRLDDGTQVTLGPDSRLGVASRYGVDERIVHLEGEAYFDVVHDDARPVAVRAGNAIARDLGTRFTVRARNEPAGVRVVVAEGKVALGHAAAQDSGAMLAAGDIGWLDSTGAPRVTHAADLTRYLAWTGGRLMFDGAPLVDVAQEIGRWYDLDLTLDPALHGRRITIALQDETLDQMLDALAFVARARYTRSGTSVTFRPAR